MISKFPASCFIHEKNKMIRDTEKTDFYQDVKGVKEIEMRILNYSPNTICDFIVMIYDIIFVPR
jgi:hypothetical protein